MPDDHPGLLLKYRALPREISDPSIFDISGYPHYENVCSNVLAFYLDPQREHGLGNLLLTSLLELADAPFDGIHDVKIQREYPTISGGRLDLLITSRTHVVGIENKIFHHLANDLPDYLNTVNQVACGRTSVHIVLSARKVKIKDEKTLFKNITYTDLWARIQPELGFHATSATQKWVTYLLDFIKTTLGFSENGMELELTDMDRFFITHEAEADRFVADRENFISKLNARVNRLRTTLDNSDRRMPPEVTRRWIYASSCLVHELTLSGHKVALDLYIGPQGWMLQFFGRNQPARQHVETIVSKRRSEFPFENDRFILEKWPLDTSIDQIEAGLRGSIEWIINAAKDRALGDDLAETR